MRIVSLKMEDCLGCIGLILCCVGWFVLLQILCKWQKCRMKATGVVEKIPASVDPANGKINAEAFEYTYNIGDQKYHIKARGKKKEGAVVTVHYSAKQPYHAFVWDAAEIGNLILGIAESVIGTVLIFTSFMSGVKL